MMSQQIAKRLLLVLSVVLISNIGWVSTDREHKVHNIVLYPDKYSWCVTTPIQQIVASPGYKSVTIDNNVCVGACYSYSIPKTQPAEPGELIGPYCDSCQPARIACYHVNLQPNDDSNRGLLQKRVQIIEDCACASCGQTRKDDCDINNDKTMELPSSLFYQTNNQANATVEEEEPELLKMQKKVSDNLHHHHHKNLVNLLEHGNGSFFGYGKVQDLLDKTNAEDDDSDVIDRIIPIPHQLGDLEEVGGKLEELVIGPHGSKVMRPVEKLHIDSDALKVNDEGVVISYETHDRKKDNLIR